MIAHHRATLLGPWLDDLCRQLFELGYSRRVVDCYVRGAVHFSEWLARRRISVAEIDDDVLHRFLRHAVYHHCACGVARGTLSDQRYGAMHMLELLRVRGFVPHAARRHPETEADRLVVAFEAHLREHRGTGSSGCEQYGRSVREFLTYRFGSRPPNLRRLRPIDVQRFISARASRVKPATAGMDGCALRRFFGFLAMHGLAAQGLQEAVPQVAKWSLATVPRHLTDQQLSTLLRAFDRDTALGRRDYALTLLMARLGLRCGEVAALQLADFDWRAATLTLVTGKRRAGAVLPVPRDVGSAVVAYLRGGRPATSCARVFVTHLAPRGEPMSSRAMRTRVRYAFKRAKLDCPSFGAHVLRHTAATQMVCAGVPFKDIADVLRHREIDTTAVYAKVDLPHLADVALPWPGAFQ